MDLRCKDGYILCNSSATDVHIGSFIVSFSLSLSLCFLSSTLPFFVLSVLVSFCINNSAAVNNLISLYFWCLFLLDQISFFLNLSIYFWLRWVFISAHRLSLVASSGGCSSLQKKQNFSSCSHPLQVCLGSW